TFHNPRFFTGQLSVTLTAFAYETVANHSIQTGQPTAAAADAITAPEEMPEASASAPAMQDQDDNSIRSTPRPQSPGTRELMPNEQLSSSFLAEVTGHCVVSAQGLLTGRCAVRNPGLPIGRCSAFADSAQCPAGRRAGASARMACTNLPPFRIAS